MSNIGIIGYKELLKMFAILGARTFPVKDAHEAKQALEKIVEEGKVKVVLLLESLAFHMRDELRNAEELDDIIVVPIPDHKTEVSLIDDQLKRLSKSAIGMEI